MSVLFSDENWRQHAKKTVKRGSLFGPFQQDTVHANADDTPDVGDPGRRSEVEHLSHSSRLEDCFNQSRD
jgi:hypothetical protein